MSFLIVVIVLIIVAFGLRYYLGIESEFGGSLIQQTEKQVIPGLNYTCDEITPEEISVLYDSSQTDKLGNSILNLREDTSLLKNNISVAGPCSYNLKPGEKASSFSCDGSFIVENKKISNKGTIQEKNPRTVTYIINFDDSSCEIVKATTWSGNMGTLKCKILSSSCKWKYGSSSSYYPLKEI